MLGKLIGWCMRDRFITVDEVKGLMGGYLSVDTKPTGTTDLTKWMADNAGNLGRQYAKRTGSPTESLGPLPLLNG